MIMIPEKTVYFKLQPSLNRASTYSVYLDSIPINFTINYHKRTTALSFTMNEPLNYLADKGISLKIYRDLNTCEFSSKFFNLDNIKNDKLNYKAKYVSIKNKFKDNVFQYFGEKTDFQVKEVYDITNKKCSNYLLALGFKIEHYKEEFSFLVFQRKCFSPKSNRFVCRNISIQFATQKGEKVLQDILKLPE